MLIGFIDWNTEKFCSLEEIENAELDVDVLSEKVKRVSYLLKLCNDKLRKTQQDVENVLKIINEKEGK